MASTDNIKKLRSVHNQMKQRCSNPNNDSYFWYGARGIAVSSEWLSFPNFFKDMSGSYKEGLQIDRIDTNKGYFKENCRWISHREQMRNVRNNHFFTFNGIYATLSDWAKILKINRSTLAQRIYVYKWPIEKALSKGESIG